ncbi:histidine kinase N-terminal 7TM domain-containing diguanylate cyclase [Marinicrinis sediminis]|uniref:Diguanylate cyclase n=1 Tax=Marinicrinis sediminis TaxID=1652465 RepID=A0ABW5R7C5_9BACL
MIDFNHSGYPVELLLAAFITILLVIAGVKHRKSPGGSYFLAFTVLALLLTISSNIELWVSTLEMKVWWRNIQQIPLFLTPILTYAIAMEYCGKRNWRTRQILFLLTAPCLVYLLLIFTDSYHHLMREELWLENIGEHARTVVKSTPFSVLFLLYTMLLHLFSVFVLLVRLRFTPPFHRKQHLILLIGYLFPIVYTIFKDVVPFGISTIAATYIPTGLLIFYGLFRYQLIDLWPVAQNVIVQHIQDGVVVVDHQHQVVEMNKSFSNWLRQGMMKGGDAISIGSSLLPVLQAHPTLMHTYMNKTEGSTELEICIRDHTVIYFFVRIVPIRHQFKQGMLLIFQDVTDRKLREQSLYLRATRDSLTGIYNRGHFIEQVKLSMREGRKTHPSMTFLLLDLDHFKKINDQHGHQAGDACLVQFAACLKEHLPQSVVFGRMGGEEFGCFCTGYSLDEARKLAYSIREMTEKMTIQLNDSKEISFTLSIGLSYHIYASTSFSELYRKADVALLRAKSSGRNRIVIARD